MVEIERTKNRKIKNRILLFFLLITSSSYTQTLNFRKAILKSDFIFVCNNYTIDTTRVNDFTNISNLRINKIDDVLKNKLSSIPKNLVIRKYEDNEDYYSDLITIGGGCLMMPNGHDSEKFYNTIFFIKKIGKEYQAFLILQDYEWEKYQLVSNQIKTISKIENLKNDQERFDKTLDWFIENGLLPDFDFLTYYEKKGIKNVPIEYSEQQYKNTLKEFLNGKEELFPIIKEKYFEEAKQYFIAKLESVLQIDEPKYEDYYAFDQSISVLTDNFNDNYESGDYILYSSLTSDKFDKYEKKSIMKHLIKTAKEWKQKITED